MSGPTQDPAHDDLVVSLPPEILAMMASYEAPADDEAPPEAQSEAQPSDGQAAADADAIAPAAADPASGEAAGFGSDDATPTPVVAGQADEAGETLTLAPVLDLTAAAALHAALLARRGAPLGLDAAEVRRLGGQCLQLLVSARKTWDADGLALTFTATSPAFDRDLALLGCSIADLTQSEAA
ncbi:MAG: STAS domain-containing protein [Methylobacterium sp.]